jgi:hypothetical protein
MPSAQPTPVVRMWAGYFTADNPLAPKRPHDADAHFENRRQKDQVRQAAAGADRSDDDNAACSQMVSTRSEPSLLASGPNSSTLKPPSAP